MAGVGSGFDLFGEAGCGELPESWRAVGLGDGKDAEVLPEFGEGAEDGSLRDLFLPMLVSVDRRSIGPGGEA